MGLKRGKGSGNCRLRGLIALGLTALLAACAGPSGHVQVDDRGRGGQLRQPVTSGAHTVQRGDTLYSIAFRYGWDWRQLAANNDIAAPYTIFPGQRLSLQPGRASPRPATASTRRQNTRPAARPAPAVPAARPAPTPRPAPGTSSPAGGAVTHWLWPSDGPLISRFQANGSLNKGIDIAGTQGQPVKAAAAGTVVYAGQGLIGYGEMLIIKHNDAYLSAYAHNSRLLVAEGDAVRAGQTIAEMGSSGTDRVKLHFEIRQRGQPVDPLRYLPAR